MEIGERVDKTLRHRAEGRGRLRDALRQRAAIGNDEAAAPLHHEKWRTDDLLVLAQQDRARCRLIGLPQARENAIFASHVVGRGRERTERRPPHDPFVSAETQQVREIRMAAVKLQHLERLAGVRDLMFAQVRDQLGPVELLLVPHVAVFGKRLILVVEFLCHRSNSQPIPSRGSGVCREDLIGNRSLRSLCALFPERSSQTRSLGSLCSPGGRLLTSARHRA